MSAKGYPLSGYETAHCDIPTEELILALIDLGHPRFYEGIPIIIKQSPPDYDSLLEKSLSANVQNPVGFLLDGALNVLIRHCELDFSSLKEAVDALFRNKSDSMNKMMRLNVPNEDEVLAWNMKEEHHKWKVMGAPSYEDMEVQFKVYG